MSHHPLVTRTLAIAASAALVSAGAGLSADPATAQPASHTTKPAAAAAGWIARSLVGAHHDHFVEAFSGKKYLDYGDTADGVLGMDAAHVARHSANRATSWLAKHIDGYAKARCGSGNSFYPGSLGKAMVVAEAQQRSVRRFGGADLPKELESEETPPGQPDAGLFGDQCEYASPITQAFALIGLSHTGRTSDRPDAASMSWLVNQQCGDGGWEGSIRSDTSQPCTKADEDVDTTGYAVQALEAVKAGHSARLGVRWLKAEQRSSGGFGQTGANTNSTAIAVEALLAGGAGRAARQGQQWIARHQNGCLASPGQRGSLNYQGHSYQGGSTTISATVQGTQALAGGVLGHISSTGSTSATPTLHCSG